MESYRGWRLHYPVSHPRLMGLVPPPPPVRLQSASSTYIWESSTLVAECKHGCDITTCLEQNHECSCGIYSRKDANLLMSEYPNLDIYGIIFNHGVVVEGERGFRSEKVTIRALFTEDFELGKLLKIAYPDVAIMLPPKEFIKKTPKERDDNSAWRSNYAKKLARQAARAQSVILYSQLYPGGFPEEQNRVAALLKGAKREDIIKFAKEYGPSNEWATRCWQGQVEKRNKVKVGDIIFRANDDQVPFVFVGSSRPNEQTSMRFMIDSDGILRRHANIRKWDEEPQFLEARKQAIEEWE